MKSIYFLLAFCALASVSMAQKTETKDSTIAKKSDSDTIRIGSILIIKNRKSKDRDTANKDFSIFDDKQQEKRRKAKQRTNYVIFDLGFANWNDQSNYATASNLANRPGTLPISAEDFKLRTGKSVNFNFWIFMQKIPLYKNNINVKYGLGVEWYNYSLRSAISFKEGGILPNTGINTNAPYIFRDSISFSKNKLNLKYLSIPLMLNFATNKQKGKPSLSTSFGVSASYLIRQRNKQDSDQRGKQKNQGDYDIQKFKLSLIGELGLGPIRLYGSYTPKSIFEKGLDIRPYNVGIRFSNW
jgi:Outer membrane protein beta-barrel domain